MENRKLEEAAEEYSIWHDGNHPKEMLIKNFIEGAKWQAERMYSEEDMIEFAKWVFLEVGSNTGKDRTNKELFNEWIEQFKK